ncbi:hypothetical protein V1515DRAFT_590231 [Lipomyces mesembrius]
MEYKREHTTFQRAEQHVDDADVLHHQLQQLHQQLQEEVQQLRADGVDGNVHVGENSGLDPDVVGMLSKAESHHDSEAHQDPDLDQDQTARHEDGEMEFSEELHMHVAQLALELQQQGLGNLSPEELQEHLMTQLASGQLTLPTNTAEEGSAVAEAEVALVQVSENHHRPMRETSTATLPSSMPEPIPSSIPESISKLLPESLPEPLPVPLSPVEHSALAKETVVDPALLSVVTEDTQSQTEEQESLIEPENKGRQEAADESAEDAATTTTLENLNELIMGMDLSDPATAIAQLQSATNIDPATLLQAVTSALSSILAGDEEEEEAEDEDEEEGERVGAQLGEDAAPRPRRKRIRKRLPPRNEEERQKLKTENRERKKRWRMRNDERNKDNDLRVRVNRRANRMFGVESSEKKTQWIENEFARRRQRRLQRIQRSFGSAGGLGNLFGQGAVSDELQAALAEIMDREGDIEKFNNTLLQLARDPNLIKNLTVMLQQMGGIGDEEGDAISTEHDQTEDYTESGAKEEMSLASAEGSEQVGREENIIDPVLLAAELNVDNGDPAHRDEGKELEQRTEPAEGDAEIQDVVAKDQDGEVAANDMAEVEVTIHDEQQNADIEAVVRALQPADMEAAAQAVASFGDLDLSGINIDENILLQAFSTIIASGILPETSTGEGEDSNAKAPEEAIQPTEPAQDPDSIRPKGTISRDETVEHEDTTEPDGTTRKRARDSEGLDEPKASRRRTSLSPTSERALPDTPTSAQSSVVATRLTEPFLPSHFVPVPPPRPAYVVSASQAPVPSPRPLPYSCPSPTMALTQEPGSKEDNPDRKKKVKAMGFPPMLKPFAAPRTAKPSSLISGAQISAQE